jgi:hypothetical protein
VELFRRPAGGSHRKELASGWQRTHRVGGGCSLLEVREVRV